MNSRIQDDYSYADGAESTPETQEDDFRKSKLLYRQGSLLLATLVQRRNYYSGDLDQFMIHMVFVLGEVKALNAAADPRSRNAAPPAPARGINIQSLSDITRIPRESVRRKLTMLIEAGLVSKSADGLLHLGPASDLDTFLEDLSPLLRENAPQT